MVPSLASANVFCVKWVRVPFALHTISTMSARPVPKPSFEWYKFSVSRVLAMTMAVTMALEPPLTTTHWSASADLVSAPSRMS